MRRARAIRIERELTQMDVAGQIGVSAPSLARFELCQTDLTASHLMQLSRVLDADPHVLMQEVDRPAVLPRVRTAPKTGGRRRAVV